MTVTNKKPILEQCYDYVDYIEPLLAKTDPDLRKEMALDIYYDLLQKEHLNILKNKIFLSIVV